MLQSPKCISQIIMVNRENFCIFFIFELIFTENFIQENT